MGRKLTCRDAGDGSGDMIVDLPDDLLQAAGWGEGDTLELEQDPNDSMAIRLRKVVLCDVCDVSTAETGHGVLQAQWRDGEAEGMRLCKSCFNYAQECAMCKFCTYWPASTATVTPDADSLNRPGRPDRCSTIRSRPTTAAGSAASS